MRLIREQLRRKWPMVDRSDRLLHKIASAAIRGWCEADATASRRGFQTLEAPFLNGSHSAP